MTLLPKRTGANPNVLQAAQALEAQYTASQLRRLAWLLWSDVSGVGSKLLQELLQVEAAEGNLWELWQWPAHHLRQTGCFTGAHKKALEAQQAQQLAGLQGLLQRYEAYHERGIRLLTWEDEAYPQSLREIFDPPACLFIQGAIEALHQPYSLGVVGTRKHTPYGQQLTQHLVEGLAGHPLSIISGLALGIDGFAHASALNAGLVTVGVLANGLDTIYPPQHVGLAEQIIAAGGALLSEQPLGMPPDASLFPRRNRLVVGLSQALLVSEAPLKSGSMISAHIALEENRTVLTVPGDVRALNSGGPHWLLRQGGIPVWEPSHVVEALNLPPLKQAPAPKTLPTSPFNSQANPQVGQSLQPQEHRATGATPFATEAAAQPTLSNTLSNPVPPAEYAAVWALLPANGRDAVSLDALAQAANLPPTELLTALTMMELEGWVRMEAGNQVLRHWPA